MIEAIASYLGSLFVIGLMVCYVAGVPTLGQLNQLTRALFKPLLAGILPR
jgi:hypothetical protein